MSNWFLSKVKFQRPDTDGVKTVFEQYLLDAVSYTEAEVRTTEICDGEDFMVDNIKKVKFEEVFHKILGTDGEIIDLSNIIIEEPNKWFKAKVACFEYDEKKGKEKKVMFNMLVYANTFIEAHTNLVKLIGTMNVYDVIGLEETQIIGVFPYNTVEQD